MVKQEIYKINDFSTPVDGGGYLLEQVWAHIRTGLHQRPCNSTLIPGHFQEEIQKPLPHVRFFTKVSNNSHKIVR